MSVVGYAFLAGVLSHLPGLVALTCGSVNSYRRLAPSMWSGAFTCWGPDNREAAVRVCSPLGASGSVNLELKPSDSSGNPYLALGGFIYAGLDGVRRGLQVPGALLVDPAGLSASERISESVTRLPATLPDALDALEADSVLMGALGPLRSAAYLAVKRSESVHFASRDMAYECRRHWMAF
jgi:glutamine synthetase